MKEVSKIVMLPVGSLRPYEKNARRHGENDVAAIAESIKEFGFNDPIGIWGKDNIVVEGHGRLEAAKLLGMDKVPAIRLDHLTDEQRRAYAIAHNRTAELSELDELVLGGELQQLASEGFDISLTGFDWDVSVGDPAETINEVDEPLVNSLPNSRVLVAGVSVFGTLSEKLIEIQISPEDAQRILQRIDELSPAEIGETIREALRGL